MLTAPVRVALAQAGLAPLFAIIGFAVAGSETALSVFYGAVTTLVASLLLVWRERTTLQHPEWGGRKLFGVFILTGLERLLAVVIMLGVGFWLLKLSPLPLLLGLALAQAAWLVVAMSYKYRK